MKGLYKPDIVQGFYGGGFFLVKIFDIRQNTTRFPWKTSKLCRIVIINIDMLRQIISWI